MDKPQSLRRFLFEAGVIAIFVLLLAGLFQAASRGGFLSPQNGAESPVPQVTDSDTGPTPSPPVREVATIEPYPPAGSKVSTPPPSIGSGPMLPVQMADLLGDQKALILNNGVIWQAGRDRSEALLEFTDVSVIFGWNYDGSKLLFGRGRYPTQGEMSDTTELWMFDSTSNGSSQLVDSQRIWSASWSPMDDRVAYCESSDAITIISLKGEVFQHRENVGCTFNWRPDGFAIAVEYSSPEMKSPDGLKFSVLGIWWIIKDELQLFSEESDENQYNPIWSIDGQKIMFERVDYGPNRDAAGIYTADVDTGDIKHLDGTSVTMRGMVRSPRTNLVAYEDDGQVIIMDFEGGIEFIENGGFPFWLPDGKTLFYWDGVGNQMNIEFQIDLKDETVGGWQYSYPLHLQPEFILKMVEGQ